jgi:DNA-binding IclR family transcriptional regulator
MPCVGPDGKPTDSGLKMLRALKAGHATAEAVATETGLPLFRVRSGLRDLTQAGLVVASDDSYRITEQGTTTLG